MTKWTEERQLEILRKIGIENKWGELATQFKPCPLGYVKSCNVWTKDPCQGCTLSQSALERKEGQ